MATDFLTSGSSLFKLCSCSSSLSHLPSFFHNISGPRIQRESRSSKVFIPRDASSAGFCLVSTYRHWLLWVLSCISCTLLETNTWNRLLSLLMYPSTTLLSVQKKSSSIWYSSSRWICWLIRTEQTAAVSSSLGMVTGLRGATRDFPITKAQWTLLVSSTRRK